MYKYIEVEYKEMLKYDGLIACKHDLLVPELNKEPMTLSSLLAGIVSMYNDIEMREILSHCKWYTVSIEKATVIDFKDHLYRKEIEQREEYESSRYVSEEEELLLNILQKVLSGYTNEAILSEISKVIKDIDGELKELVETKLSKNLEKMDKIIEMRRPNNILLTIKEINKCLDEYIEEDGRVFMDYTGVLGNIISYDDYNIRVELSDNKEVLDLFYSIKNRRVEFLLLEDPVTKNIRIGAIYILER